jgi:LacI family transcriptional regulator
MISADHEAIVRMACDYFLQNNFQHLAFCGISRGGWSKSREDAFVQYLGEQSVVPHVYPRHSCLPKEHLREQESHLLAKWLHRLPKPVAILACNDERGQHLLKVCNAEGIKVPESVSVLGIDNDDFVCELTLPPLSSIALNVSQSGYEAMKILMATIADPDTPPQTIYNFPVHITERHSVNVSTSNDELVAKALQYIRQNFLLPIQVADVARFVGCSRRSLERHFALQSKKTIVQHIQAMRLERAKQLLVHTEDSVNKVTMASGFEYFQPMLQLFREQLQCTPKEYREKHKLPSPTPPFYK